MTQISKGLSLKCHSYEFGMGYKLYKINCLNCIELILCENKKIKSEGHSGINVWNKVYLIVADNLY